MIEQRLLRLASLILLCGDISETFQSQSASGPVNLVNPLIGQYDAGAG